MMRTKDRVTKNVRMKAIRQQSKGSRPLSWMSWSNQRDALDTNQWSTLATYACRRRPSVRRAAPAPGATPITLLSDMSMRQAPGVGIRPGQLLLWCLLWLAAAAGLGYVAWQLFGHTPYRIDIDVYQMGARAWLDGHPLYRGDVQFHTPIGLNLPFTYPRSRPSSSARSPGCTCPRPASRSPR